MGVSSAEIRWWGPAPIPPPIGLWFDQRPFRPGGGGIRTDRYLPTGSDAVSIKYRGGTDALEVKSLVETLSVDAGEAERLTAGVWIKHSLSLELNAPTLSVGKRRLLRLFDCTGDAPKELALGRDETVSDGEWPAEGCTLELSQVARENGNWWSVCFEGFGTPRRVADHLAATLAMLAPLPEALVAARRASYPEWLLGGE